MDERDVQTDSGGSLGYVGGTSTASPIPTRLTLNLGIVDVPYANPPSSTKTPKAKKGKANKPIKPKAESGTQTTGDVAEYLEKDYGVMQTFYDVKEEQIAKALESSVASALENLMMGSPAIGNPFAEAQDEIEAMFKHFISSQEVEHAGIGGVPTQAALNGVNHRLKHPYAKGNPRRPSFSDTGLYVAKFKAWVS